MGFTQDWIDFNYHNCWRCVLLRPKRCKKWQGILQRMRGHVPADQRFGF